MGKVSGKKKRIGDEISLTDAVMVISGKVQ